MFGARMRTTLAQLLDQTCFNRLATHFNISLFGHQTMFDDVWSPNISHLVKPFNLTEVCDTVLSISSCWGF